MKVSSCVDRVAVVLSEHQQSTSIIWVRLNCPLIVVVAQSLTKDCDLQEALFLFFCNHVICDSHVIRPVSFAAEVIGFKLFVLDCRYSVPETVTVFSRATQQVSLTGSSASRCSPAICTLGLLGCCRALVFVASVIIRL